jgi:uncharacterized protein YkwD
MTPSMHTVMNMFASPRTRWLLGGALCAAFSAQAQQREPLVDLINAYRATSKSCGGKRLGPVPPLTPQPALSNLHITSGTFLESALQRAGYPVAKAGAISLAGAGDAASVMAMLEHKYCKTLSSAEFSAIGVTRAGYAWLIVLAQPAPPRAATLLPETRKAGKQVLAEVNTARASPRRCGAAHFPAAPPLTWNAALADAALAHSQAMARDRFFNHQGMDGRLVGERAVEAGYLWRRVGENIAVGQASARDVVDGWLDSPGHCANIMHKDYTEMGAAYAVNSAGETDRVYWTQVFGTPR